MFSGLARTFGIVSVVEKNGQIHVSGIPADILTRAMSEVYKNNRLNKFLFTQVEKNKFSFYSFFAVEVEFIMTELRQRLTSYRHRRAVNKILRELREHTWLKSTTDETLPSIVDLSYLRNILWPPKPHQLEFLEQFGREVPRYQLNGYLLAAPPGTGKTFMDLALAACVIPRHVAEVKIIISPKNAVDLVWADTVQKLFRKEPTYWTSETTGAAPIGMEYYIFHYESLSRAQALMKEFIKLGIKVFIIIDESHNFNTNTSIRTQDLVELCTMQPGQSYSIWASGSPIKALGTECIPFLRAVDPKFTVQVELAFRKIFGGDASAATEILYHRLGRVTYKISKKVVIDVEPIVYRRRVKLRNSNRYLTETVRAEMAAYIKERVEFYKKDMLAYKQSFEECLAFHRKKLTRKDDIKRFDEYLAAVNTIRQYGGGFAVIREMSLCKAYEAQKLLPSLPVDLQRKFRQSRSIVKTLLLKVRGEALGRILGKRRAECASDLAKACKLEEIVNDALAKTLVFSSYVESIQTASKYLQNLGYTTREVYGETNKDLNTIIRDFYNVEEINPICATYKSLSTAVPIICANTIVMLDVPPRQYMWDQTISRCHRLGQENPVYIYEITLDTGNEPNVSTRSEDIIVWSRNQVTALLGAEFSGPGEDEYEIEKIELSAIDG